MQTSQDHGAPFVLAVTALGVGSRLDVYVARLAQGPNAPAPLAGLSRSRVQQLIGRASITVRTGGCARRGFVGVPAAYKLHPGDAICLAIDPPRSAALQPQPMALNILYEDADILALNKAAGVVVHPGAGVTQPTVVHGLLAHCRDLSGIGGVSRPGIVHRLDKDTSGVLMVAKHDRAHLGLSRMFAARQVHKVYKAVVWGTPAEPQARWCTSFARHPTKRQCFTSRPCLIRRSGGRPREAVTAYTQVGTRHGLTCLLVTLQTGRTHQIRVHLADHGHPIVGDALYGGARGAGKEASARVASTPALTRHALHAWQLRCLHPCTGLPLHFEAPVDCEMEQLWHSLVGCGHQLAGNTRALSSQR